MKRLVLIGLLAMALVNQTSAQEQLSLKQQADQYFERYEYFKSIGLYLKIANKNHPEIQVMERLADCYRNINQYQDAEIWYAKAVADTKASKISHYYYAGVLLRDGKFDQAKAQYKIYFANDPAGLALKLSDCDSAILWMRQPTHYQIKNETGLNTQYSDWGLNYDGKTGLIFTSDRFTGDDNTDNRTGNSWFKMYRQDLKSGDIQQLSFSNESNENFEGDYHIGPMALNAAGDTAYITVTTGIAKNRITLDKDVKGNQRLYTRRLQLLIAKKSNDQWVITGSFPYNNIQQYSVSSAALSRDGRLLYFTSDMPGSQGKTDIWYCQKLADGTWGKPVNCGNVINTKDAEDFPCMADNGDLYFASKGLPGMGGYDIYRAKGEKDKWTTPEDLKYPINSTSDDFYLVTHDGLSGYLSSNRADGQGNDDIYSFSPDKQYAQPLKPVKKPDAPHQNVAIPTPNSVNDYALKVIYYDLDKSNIRPDAVPALDSLAIILKQHPAFNVEVSSYTDSRASGGYNLALSKRRAIAATDYLIEKGIASRRIIYVGYGKTNLVNKCADGVNCTEAEHQLNRRTEFKLIANYTVPGSDK